jgi:photosystem II stability/assembly factor-like uncharacterized protein
MIVLMTHFHNFTGFYDMKNLKILAVLILASNSVTAQWHVLPVPAEPRYDDVFFLDADVGFAAGGSGRKIYKTTDGGLTWTMQIQLPEGHNVRSIEFMNDLVGFAGTLSGKLYRTVDGGTTWTDITANFDTPPPGVCGLSSPKENVIYATGRWTGSAYVAKSTDGGNTWTTTNMTGVANRLVDLFFFNENRGFVIGQAKMTNIDGVDRPIDGGIILYTEDGGANWTVKHKTLVEGDIVWKIQTPDSLHFFGSIQSNASTGNIRMLKSVNEGDSWNPITVANQWNYVQMIGFISPTHGWTGGSSWSDISQTVLYETTDGGETWNQMSLGARYNRFFMLNDSTAFMSGQRLYKYAPWMEPLPLSAKPEITKVHDLIVFPNPVRNLAKIEMQIDHFTNCQLTLISLDGKELERVFDGTIGAGKHPFELDLRKYPGQVFLLVMETDAAMVHRKIVKR